MSRLDDLKRALVEKVERDAVIDNRIQDELKRQVAKDAAHIEIRAREDLDAWAMCFQSNLNLLLADRHIELHYETTFLGSGFKWTSQARYNHAPDISLRAISGNSGKLFQPYAVKVTELLGMPFLLYAVWHEIDVYPYHTVPHKKGSLYYGRTDQRSYGHFGLAVRKD